MMASTTKSTRGNGRRTVFALPPRWRSNSLSISSPDAFCCMTFGPHPCANALMLYASSESTRDRGQHTLCNTLLNSVTSSGLKSFPPESCGLIVIC